MAWYTSKLQLDIVQQDPNDTSRHEDVILTALRAKIADPATSEIDRARAQELLRITGEPVKPADPNRDGEPPCADPTCEVCRPGSGMGRTMWKHP